jgi:hypothetical protein
MPKTFKMTSYGTPANPSRFRTTGTTVTDNAKRSTNREPNPFRVLNDDSSVTEFRRTVREVPSRSEISDEYIELEEQRPKAFDT